MQKQLGDTGPDGFPIWTEKCTANLDHHRRFCLPEAPQLPQATAERIRDRSDFVRGSADGPNDTNQRCRELAP